jgi:signal transduction histidine kinase
VRTGIRLQILFALGLTLVVALVPLHFAVARLTEVALMGARRDAARDLGRAIGAYVLSAHRGRDRAATDALLEAQLSEGGVTAVALYDEGTRTVVAGNAADLPGTAPRHEERSEVVETQGGKSLRVVIPGEGGATAVVAVAIGAGRPAELPLVRLVALYTGVVALGLLVLAYFGMTRLVVRPIESLSSAAGRVASGARSLEIPTGGAMELADLGSSLQSMTDKLLSDEHDLRVKIEELERTTRDLRAAQDSLVRSERLASVGRLAAGMAHEVGNPIAALMGFEELLLAGDLSPEEQRDFLVRMKKETERIHRVLRNLLDFARVKEDVRGRGRVDAAIEAVTTLLKPQKDMRDVEVETKVQPDLPEVSLGDERLEQVILNLVLNAADAIPKTGGRVRITAHADGDDVVVSVDDNGPGVVPSVRDKLFEPFVTTKEVGKGTGLGLAVCRGLVEAAGGTITAEDSDLGGASFVLRFPRAPSPAGGDS